MKTRSALSRQCPRSPETNPFLSRPTAAPRNRPKALLRMDLPLTTQPFRATLRYSEKLCFGE
jgi:hypothetical protein